MAHIYKPTVVKPIPKNASVRTIDGAPCACWTNRRGKKVQAELTADGKKCRVPSPTWWIEYTAAGGKRERVRGYPSREATAHLATDLERRAIDIQSGRAAPRREAPAHLADHLPDFRAALQGKGNGERHIGYVLANVGAVLDGLKITTPATVDCARITTWLKNECGQRGRGPETYNRTIKHLRQFGRWLVRSDRAEFNAFEKLATVNSAQHRERFRRRLSDFEFAQLLATARGADGTVHGLCGPDRARLYLLAAYTGFRMGALANLTPESFVWPDRAGLPHAVTASARLTKNKKPHTVPLHQTVAAELVGWLRHLTPGCTLFPRGRWSTRGSEVVAADLARARSEWVGEARGPAERTRREASDVLKKRNAAGEVFDFHSFRTHFISSLALAGVPLTAAQQLADHSTPTLTANVYTRWGGELAEQVAKLPGVPGVSVPVRVRVGVGRRKVPTPGNEPRRKMSKKL